jgi:hypothetical protein
MAIVKSNTKFIGLVYPLTLILVTLSTYIIRTSGPIPYIDPNNTWVSNPEFALEEPRDLYILLCWWLISLIILFIFVKAPTERVQKKCNPYKWYRYSNNRNFINLYILNLVHGLS